MKKVEAIVLCAMVADGPPDLSYLGSYSDVPDRLSIEVKHRQPGQCLYFNPAAPHSAEQAKALYERFREYEAGKVSQIGVMAHARVLVGGGGWESRIIAISSAGLWGVESDWEAPYLKTLGEGQIDDLKAILEEFGFTPRELEEVPIVRKLDARMSLQEATAFTTRGLDIQSLKQATAPALRL